MHISSTGYCPTVKLILSTKAVVATWHFTTSAPIPRVGEDIALNGDSGIEQIYRIKHVIYRLQENEILIQGDRVQ